jgi:hypothetical protein
MTGAECHVKNERDQEKEKGREGRGEEERKGRETCEGIRPKSMK